MSIIKWLLSDPWRLIILLCILIMPTWYMELTHTDDSIVRYLTAKHERSDENG